MSETEREIASQPGIWRRAAALVPDLATVLPSGGARVAVIGCGTSWFMSQSFAILRELHGHGETDAFTPAEMPANRDYDCVLAISRSGTTTEVVETLSSLPGGTRSVAITAVAGTPITEEAGEVMLLDFADEASVVQTRFATSALALLGAHVGRDIEPLAVEAERALAAELPLDPASFEHFVFLGHGWTVGLANEAALKVREAAQAWAESYPAMEYRHGPISVAGPRTAVWALGPIADGLARQIAGTGATLIRGALDPMVELVNVQRAAVALAATRGLDVDRPKHLTRSVVLPGGEV